MSVAAAETSPLRAFPAYRRGRDADGGEGEGDRVGTDFSTYQHDRAHPGDRPKLSRHAGKVLWFTEDFDAPAASAPPEPEIIEPTFSRAQLEAARAEAFRAGGDAAAAQVASADQALIREAVTAIAANVAAARDDLRHRAEETAASIARLLLGSLGAVLPELAARYGEIEMQAVIRAVLPGLFKEPGVTVRVNPRHAAAIAQEIETADPDLAARLQVVATDAIPPGDMRVAWRNGAASRDAGALWAQVTEALALAGLAPLPVETRELEHAG